MLAHGWWLQFNEIYFSYFLLSWCPPVTHFSNCFSRRIIMTILGVITIDKKVMSMQKVKVKGHRSRSQRSKQILWFPDSSPFWIHRWLRNLQSLQWHRRGAQTFFEVIHQIWRSHRTKIANFDPNRPLLVCNSILNWRMAMKWCKKLEEAQKRCPIENMPYCFFFTVIYHVSMWKGTTNCQFWTE